MYAGCHAALLRFHSRRRQGHALHDGEAVAVERGVPYGHEPRTAGYLPLGAHRISDIPLFSVFPGSLRAFPLQIAVHATGGAAAKAEIHGGAFVAVIQP